MSQTVLRQEYLSPFDTLYDDPYVEDAWFELFGDRLYQKTCHVIIQDIGIIRTSRSSEYRQYRRRNLAYCW